jgi:hypothetical protein
MHPEAIIHVRGFWVRDEVAFGAHGMEVAVSMHQLGDLWVSVRTFDHQQRPLHAE